MRPLAASVAEFLRQQHIAVVGVSRDRNQPANAIYRKLRDSGREVFAVNPRASEVEGAPCYADLASVPGPLEAAVIVTPPDASVDIVRQCAARGIGRVWLHRSFGQGSASPEAVAECGRLGIACIPSGCPMMFCEPVDVGHRCFRWWLGFRGRLPR